MEKKNIFQLWQENGKELPIKVVLDSWNESKHYALVEEVIITGWPYGKAFGQYFFDDKPGERGEIKNAGTYRWKLKG